MNKKRRDELIDSIALQIIEGMDHNTIEQYVYEQLSNYYDRLTDMELIEELENYYECNIDEI
jgi:hypothetical protein